MAVIAGLTRMTGSLAKAFLKSGRKNKAENKLITDAYTESKDKGYKGTRAKFVDEGTKIAKQKQKRKTGNIPDPSVKKKTTGKEPLPKIKGESKRDRAIRRGKINRLRREQIADERAQREGKSGGDTGASQGGRQRIDIPVSGSRRKRRIADPHDRLRSSEKFSDEELANWTYDEVQEYLTKGVGGKASVNLERMLGRRSPPARGKKKGDMDQQSRKYGGKVKRNMGGPVRGVGAATKGFGKATYSNKMY